MLFNTRFKTKLLHLSTLIIIICQTLVFSPSTVLAAERPIYVAGSQEDYLRLVSLSLHGGYIPLLFSQGGEQTTAILHFADLYKGNPAFLESQDIDRLILQRWSHVETVVLSQDETHFGILAAVIASALDTPLYFGSLPNEDLQHLGVQQVLALGDVTVPGLYPAKRLESVQSARALIALAISPDRHSVVSDFFVSYDQ